jgi:Nucleotidyl transferase AbiEii toxin, Type IV TA system
MSGVNRSTGEDRNGGTRSSAEAARELPYTSAAAFRTALKVKFIEITKHDPRFSVAELQRQFAYDRILSRCFSADDADRWILKGAGALLARLPVARHSKDIDLYYAERAAAPDAAVAALARAADRDVGGHFRFELTKTTPLQETSKGRRVHLCAYLGSLYATFHVDVVVDTSLSGEPDTVPPLTPLRVDGLLRPSYRVFPLPDHCADKLCAIIETHEQAGAIRRSTRVKDLVDLALIARTQHVDGQALRIAILSGIGHRRLPLPTAFSVPDLPSWSTGFAKTCAAVPSEPMTFPDAVDLVSRFLNPILTGPITGTWDPHTSSWRHQ